jgi:hypothetical protein
MYNQFQIINLISLLFIIGVQRKGILQKWHRDSKSETP